jgi:HAE1 family hydrophobic/amphiphilic exporter-1
MVFLATMVFGGFSMRMLPLNLMPDISYPKLTVRTEYPGAAPAEVENNVSRPIEEILGVVTGLIRIESISRAGYSDVILEFSWDTDMDDANQDVLEKLDAIEPLLPEEVKQPLILRYDPTLDPVLTLSLSGTGSRFAGIPGLKFLRRISERDVRRVLEPVDGVAAVKVKGGLEEEIEVELDEDALRRTGIGISTVITRLQAENINLAGGALREGVTRYLVRTVNEFTSLEDIRSTVITTRQGRDVRLRDIGRVVSGYKDRDVITRVDGHEAVEIEVYKEADANIVDMADRVRERIATTLRPRLEKDYGAAVHIVSDRSQFIEASIDQVRNTALLGGFLAVLVLFLFLRDLKTTVIVALSIPISVLVTFAPLKMAGVSLNIMSLGGLALGIGMLVDNSIVVLESVYRCREEGDDLIRATMRGTAEVGSAVSASTLTSIAVFFPMVFVQGVAGQMFGDLGLTVVFSLIASLAVALFFIPMLASRRGFSAAAGAGSGGTGAALRRTWTEWYCVGDLRASLGGFKPWHWATVLPPVYVLLRFVVHLALEILGKLSTTLMVAISLVLGGLFVVLRKLFGTLLRPFLWFFGLLMRVVEGAYPPVLRWSLGNRITVYLLALGCIVFTVVGAARLDSELIPELHQGEFTVEVSLPVGTPLEVTDSVLRELEGSFMNEVPHVQSLTTTVGSERDSMESGERGDHTARLRVTLEGREVDLEGRDAGRGDEASEEEEGEDAKEAAGSRLLSSLRPKNPSKAEEEALQVVRELVSGIPDLKTHVTRPVLFSFKTPIEIEIRGHELADLARATAIVEERIAQVPGLRDVRSSIQPGSPEIQIVYDRDALARQNLDIRRVAELVRDKVQGNEATEYNRKDRKIPVRVRLEGITKGTVNQLRGLVVNPGAPRPIPLEAVAELSLGRGPNEIRRIGQQRVGVVTSNLEGVALGGVGSRISEVLSDLGELPGSVTTAITGQSEEWRTSSSSLYFALGLSVFLVYVIMASQFESLLHPLLILVTIPLAFLGVVIALLLLDIPLSVVVFLGMIMLAGIVVNNAIVLVDYINQIKARGNTTEEAIVIAGSVRLRPILMTTLTTVLGLLPMAVGLGDGAEIRMPMAVTVIAGLVLSTLLTLIVIPTLYAGADRLFSKRGLDPAEELARQVASVQASQLAPEVPRAGPPQTTDEPEG